MSEDRSLLDRIKAAVNNITTLEVTTRVGEVNVTKKRGGDPEVEITDERAPTLYTRIDLLDADTLNSMSPSLLDGAHADLRSFHQQAVRDAQDLIHKRLEMIERLVQWAKGSAGEELKEASTAPALAPTAAQQGPEGGT